jgi:hypothetical protein
LDPNQVPPRLRALLPIARRWGLPDDGYRWDSVEKASLEELNSIIDVVDGVSDDDLYGWLAGPEAKRLPPTDEYVAVTCLTMAVVQARLRAGRRGGP